MAAAAGEVRAACGLAAWAASASRPARPGGRAGPAVGSAWGLRASWANSVAWASWATKLSRPGYCEASSSFLFPFSVLFFFFLDLNSNLV